MREKSPSPKNAAAAKAQPSTDASAGPVDNLEGRMPEIWRENQLRLVGFFSHYLQGFSTIQTVVGLGISEPSTVGLYV